MSEFINLISHHDINTLEADAKELEGEWPAHAAEVYQLMAQRCEKEQQQHYSIEAQRCQEIAEQQKQQKKAAFIAMSMS